MAGPWEAYAPAAEPPPATEGPWSAYKVKEETKPPEKKFGLGDTWPARLAKSIYSAVTLPHDVMTGEAHVPGSPEAQAIPGAVPFGSPDSSGERIADLAMLASPQSVANRGAVPAVTSAEAAASPGQEVAAAANRLSAAGAPVEVPKAVATDSMGLQRVAATARNVPLAGDPLVKASERTLEQLGSKADEVSAGYGGGTVAGSGEAASTGIKNWITGESKTKANALYDQVDNLVNPQTTTPLINTRNIAAEIQAERDAAHLPVGKAVDTISEATSADGLTYQGIKTLRTKIGEAMDSSILPEGMSGADLKRIYGALTDDLRSSVLVGGSPKAVAQFDRANNYYKLVSDRREALAKVVGADGNVPAEQVFERLKAMASSSGRADNVKLAQARKVIGADDWNEFVSGVIGKLGRDVEGNFSPNRFITDYNKLSDAGKNILFSSGGKGELARHLDDIATVSSRFKELQKFSNPSGTSQSLFGGSIGAGMLPILHGDIVTPLVTVGTVLSARTLSYALSKPATAASVAKLARAQAALAAAPSRAALASYNIASRNLISTLGDKAQGITPADFIRHLQGPVPAGAQNEQR